MAQIIDGKAFAAGLRKRISDAVTTLKDKHNITPGLAVILVGDDPASSVYVRNKKKMTIEVGMNSYDYPLPASTSQDQLLQLVGELNANQNIHGVLVQLPLPDHIDETAIINAIDPAKDVDGFHVVNTGKLTTGQNDALISCTPLGCLMLLQNYFTSPTGRGRNDEDISGEGENTENPHPNPLPKGEGALVGKHAVVIGRSNIVGKPMAQLLLNESCTVTICHSRTQNIEELCAQADIIVAAVGRPKMVKADWVKDGATVIDVGINRVDGKLVGDVDFDAVSEKASAITPVPGGVGPMTIACLLRNTLQAACQIHDVTFELT